MTRVQLHLPSALGGLLAGAAALAAVQSTQQTVAFGPYGWRDLVRVEESSPFAVPEGRVLVITSAGHTARGNATTLSEAETALMVVIDGKRELMLNPVNGPSTLDPGWVVQPGSRVQVHFADDTWTGYVFGYLVDI